MVAEEKTEAAAFVGREGAPSQMKIHCTLSGAINSSIESLQKEVWEKVGEFQDNVK